MLLWLLRFPFAEGSEEALRFKRRLRHIKSVIDAQPRILDYGVDSRGSAYVALELLEGESAFAAGRSAEEVLFRTAEVLSEGGERAGPGGDRRYFGSTMITFDLEHLRPHWRGDLDAAARAEVTSLIEGSVRMRVRAMRLACAEVARRVTDRPLGTALVETSVRLSGTSVQMDVDLEVPIGVCSPVRRAP